MIAGGMLLSVSAVLFALLGAFYIHIKPALSGLGVGRIIGSVGSGDCKIVPQLQACESRSSFHVPGQTK